ncbi:MAG TPA: metallophosphoesterase, partial [Ignavibacteriaceae bacterium]|nr:metallophosphoesterase [Ignavibacteriaceae bacterium]
MKKSASLLFLISFLSIHNLFAQDTLTILHLNDTHSTLSPIGPRNESLQGTQGGIARAATVIGLTKMSEPNVLTLHAGDVFIGDLFFNVYFGVAEFQLLNSLGLDAMTVGNHEWDLTPAALLGALQNSFLPGEGFPLLSSNLIFPINIVHDTLQDYISTITIKEMGKFKVGIFGLTTPEANVTSLPGPYFIDANIVEIAAAMVDTLMRDT